MLDTVLDPRGQTAGKLRKARGVNHYGKKCPIEDALIVMRMECADCARKAQFIDIVYTDCPLNE